MVKKPVTVFVLLPSFQNLGRFLQGGLPFIATKEVERDCYLDFGIFVMDFFPFNLAWMACTVTLYSDNKFFAQILWWKRIPTKNNVSRCCVNKRHGNHMRQKRPSSLTWFTITIENSNTSKYSCSKKGERGKRKQCLFIDRGHFALVASFCLHFLLKQAA